MTLAFQLSDNPQVRPEHLCKRSKLINSRIDLELHKVCQAAAQAAGQTLTLWTIASVRNYLFDLDNVLLAIVDGRSRRKSCLTRSHQLLIPAPYCDDLQEALNYLKKRGYGLTALGSLVEACLILRADAENLLPKIK